MTKVSELEGAELDFYVAKAEGYIVKRGKEFLGAPHPEWDAFDLSDHAEDEKKLYTGSVPGKEPIWGNCKKVYHYSTDWSRGGPIIEREHIWLDDSGGCWEAIIGTSWKKAGKQIREGVEPDKVVKPINGTGPTPLIAAMRAYVASKFGDTVDD